MSAQHAKQAVFAAVFVMLAVLPCGQVFAQMSVTGSVSGTVMDASGAMVPGATVKLTSETTKQARETKSNSEGLFSFTAVPRDSYTLKIERTGFKAIERTGITVSANEHVALSALTLELGSASETVTVAAEAAHVATESSEETADVTTDQSANLTARGREVVSMLRTIPGATYQADQDSPGGQYGTGTPSIRGAAAGMNILAVDGIVSNDMGTPSVFSSATQLDAIGEVKVILNSYQAEYAGNGGTVVQVVTKSGTVSGTATPTGTCATTISMPTTFSTTATASRGPSTGTTPAAFRWAAPLPSPEIEPQQDQAVRLL